MVLVLLLACLVITASGPSKGGVTGKNVDAKNNTALAGVTISIDPGGLGATSDVEGRFQFNLAAGSYNITFGAVSYAPKSLTGVVVKSGAVEELNIVLEPKSQAMEAV